MVLDPEILALFSDRARRVLRRARRSKPASRRAIVARLAKVGRPAFDAVVDFERTFGGLQLELGRGKSKQYFKFGIEWHAPRPDADDPEDPERTMVPIGSGQNGYQYLYMNAQGEVVVSFDSIVMKNESIFYYIEQHILAASLRRSSLKFEVDLRPAIGVRLADVLALAPIEEVSDSYEAWWKDDKLMLIQVLFPGCWQSGETRVLATTIEGIVRVLQLARDIEPDIRVNASASPYKRVRLSKTERAQAAAIDHYASVPGARRYAFGDESSHMTGAVWVIERNGEFEIQQYRVFIDETGEDPPELLLWETLTASGEVSRDMEG